MITADLHTHSSFSSDSSEPLENIVRAAEEKGLKTVCLTEHNDFDYPGGEFILDTKSYRDKLFEVRERYRGRMEVLFGVELGVMDHLAKRLEEYESGFDFDFIIGSSHLVNGEDPYYPEYFAKRGDKNGLLSYFESILANIKAFDGYDVYGHLDYAVRYSAAKSYAPADFADITDEILRELISRGKGIELNTAGLKYGLGWAHPHPEILRRYRELGGELITVGSDAHAARDVAYGFGEAADILRAAGFSRYAVFKNRKPVFIEL